MPMVTVTFYTRPGCHLCDEAKAAMESWARPRGLSIELREVNIDEDVAAHERFWLDIPVAMIGEREVFRHRFDPEALERLAPVAASDDATMSDLSSRRCVPCRGGDLPLRAGAITAMRDMLGGEWAVVGEHHLEKNFRFPDFATALEFVNRIGVVAETEGHHPEIRLGWGRVGVAIWTHVIDGLTENDFVLAAKIDRVASDEDER